MPSFAPRDGGKLRSRFPSGGLACSDHYGFAGVSRRKVTAGLRPLWIFRGRVSFPRPPEGGRAGSEIFALAPRGFKNFKGQISAAHLPDFKTSAGRLPMLRNMSTGVSRASKNRRGAARVARRGSVGFSEGFGAYSKMFAAELAVPSKLQQWAGASCKISAARSPGASKNPQGASQASTYFAVRATVKSLGLSGLRENLEERQIFPRCEGSTYLRRSCPRLQNFRAARASIYLRRVLQGLQKIRALVRPLGILRGKQKLWKVSR